MSVRSVTAEEWQLIKDADEILTRLGEDLPTYIRARNKATRKWENEEHDFLEISGDNLILVHIETYGDDEWERATISFPAEELFNLNTLYEQHLVIGAVVDETQRAESEKRAREQREAQYKALREEFEGGLV